MTSEMSAAIVGGLVALSGTVILTVSGFFLQHWWLHRHRRQIASQHQQTLINAMLDPWAQATQGMSSEQIYHFVRSVEGQRQQELVNVLMAMNNTINALEQRHLAVVNYIVQRDNLLPSPQPAVQSETPTQPEIKPESVKVPPS